MRILTMMSSKGPTVLLTVKINGFHQKVELNHRITVILLWFPQLVILDNHLMAHHILLILLKQLLGILAL
jgi:hypothetical protein